MNMKKYFRNGLQRIIAAGILYAMPLAAAETRFKELEEQLVRHEGYKERMYFDSRGIPTIGIGFNLRREDARRKLKELGADYENVLQGKQALKREQIYYLLREDIKNSELSARRILKNYDSQPHEVRDIVLDMIFNLGETRFSKFKKTIAAIDAFDYKTAANEMQNSLWYNQVGNRGKYLVEEMRKVKYREKHK